MKLPFAESWKIKMVEPIRKSTREEREQWIKEAHYNVFQLKSGLTRNFLGVTICSFL